MGRAKRTVAVHGEKLRVQQFAEAQDSSRAKPKGHAKKLNAEAKAAPSWNASITLIPVLAQKRAWLQDLSEPSQVTHVRNTYKSHTFVFLTTAVFLFGGDSY